MMQHSPMFFGVTASFQGVSASVLYGAPPPRAFNPPPPPAEHIIDVEARSIHADDRKNSTYADSQRLSSPLEAVTYAAPTRRGEPPRVIQTAAAPGRLLDVYA